MRILVTGGAGFIGSHVVDRYVTLGHEVAVVDNLSTGRRDYVHPGARLYELDIRDGERLRAALAEFRPELVSHHAAEADVTKINADPTSAVRTNVEGTASLLQACLAAGVGRAIYASTYGVYGEPERRPVPEDHPLRPVTAYAITKLAGEQLARYYAAAFGIAVTVLRYANVYGPRQTAKGEGGVVGVFAYQARAGQPLTIAGDGSQTRDFVYVGDVAAANVLALERGVGETFNISSGVETSIAELAALLGPLAGAPAAPVFVPPRPVDIYRIAADPTRAAETLGWRPSTALRDGLRYYLAWLDGAGP